MSNIEFKVELIRNPLKTKSADWQETAYEWSVVINKTAFKYFTGCGHVIKNPFGVFPKKPTLDDVLYCLVSDASACDQSFEDWCADYGYDTDSRKALETYLQCQENASKLRKAKVNIEAERERLQDY